MIIGLSGPGDDLRVPRQFPATGSSGMAPRAGAGWADADPIHSRIPIAASGACLICPPAGSGAAYYSRSTRQFREGTRMRKMLLALPLCLAVAACNRGPQLPPFRAVADTKTLMDSVMEVQA